MRGGKQMRRAGERSKSCRAQHLTHLVRDAVTRYEVPGIHAFNFVYEQALGGGGLRSLRNDPLGKGMAQILPSLGPKDTTSISLDTIRETGHDLVVDSNKSR
jgi:hypothetical protein